MNDDVKVSVICLVFNHEKFLRECLESLTCQKTNFKYEILVHDDASTDGSKQIIEEFYKKFPNIIVPILQKENQYQKNINVTNDVLLPMSKGKYYCFCEGDDKWCNENKLQKQYDYMEEHPECSICLHNTIMHDLSGQKKDKLFNNWKEIHTMNAEEVFFGWNVHTSSMFFNKNNSIMPKFTEKYWFGDYARLTIAYSKGNVDVLPDVMSVYNANNVDGMTKLVYNVDTEKNIKKIEERKAYLKEFNEYTNNKYKDIVDERINEVDIEITLMKFLGVKNKEEYKILQKELFSNPNYKTHFARRNLIGKIKFILKYKCYAIFKLIK